MLKTIFIGSDGLRAGWRFLLFLVVFTALQLGLGWVISRFVPITMPSWTAPLFIAGELFQFVIALIAVAVMTRIERRSFATYGFPAAAAFGRLFWEGAAWGVGAIVGVIAMIAVFGGYTVSGFALHGGQLVLSASLWLVAFLLVALFEELAFRGYSLFTLGRGMGFWPAAILLSAIFGALHYFEKPMENLMDAASVALIGLFFCLTVRRTGDVWFAIGWHTTFNYLSMGVFGAPNTGNNGQPVIGHLLESAFQGPEWLTGGPRGPEASAFIFVIIAVTFAAFVRRFRQAKFLVSQG